MSLFHLFILAVIQGVTEFLPISSSGHLILLPSLTGAADQGHVLDVAVHVGTLFAVILYFRSDVVTATIGFGRLVRGKVDTQGAFLALCLVIGTIPVIVVGFILEMTGLAYVMRSVAMIGWAILGFGILLYWADMTGTYEKTDTDWSLKDAWIMGLAQAVALIPGTSRSGITITAARRLGYGREGAAKLSMLMSIPTIIASGVLLGLHSIGNIDLPQARDAAIGAFFAFVAALIALALMMRLLRSVSFTPYVIYRIIFGAGLLIWAYS